MKTDLAEAIGVLGITVSTFFLPWPLGVLTVLIMVPRTVNQHLDRRSAKHG